MAGYIGKSQGKILTNVEGNSVETADIQDSAVTETKIAAGSVTDTKLNSTKLNGIEAGADVTDTANVTAAGALMDSEVTNLAQVKAFSSADYATAAQGATADSALQDITGESIEDLSDVATMTPTDGQLLTWDSATSKWNAEDAPVSLPDQTGNSGKYLTTDGTDASWGTVDLSSKLDTTATFGGDVSGTYNAIVIADDSHNHIISNVDGLQTALDGKQPLSTVLTNTTASFTTADESKLDGIESGATADQTASEILTAIKTVDGSGSGLDADLLDGQQGSYYYPASNPNGYTTNVGDITGVTAGTNLTGGGTSGSVTLNVSSTPSFTSATFGSGVSLQESTQRADLLQITSSTSGWAGLQIRNSSNEGRWSFMTDGSTAGIYDDEQSDWVTQHDENGETRLYYNGSEKFNTNSSGCTVTGDLSVTGSISGAGKVLQVVQAKKTSFFSTSSTSYVDVSGVSATITPSSTSSKILVTLTGAASGSASNSFAYGVLVRGSTNIVIGDSRGSAQRCTFDLTQQAAGDPRNWAKHFAITYLDSPSTTSATTYKLQVKRTLQSIGIGGTYDTADGNRSNVPTILTLMEIAG